MTFTYDYPKADLTVDVVLFRIGINGCNEVLLIKRADNPFKGLYALPGGYVEIGAGETCIEAAARELSEETGLVSDTPLKLVGVFDTPNRDPRGRVVSLAYCGWVQKTNNFAVAGSDAEAVVWANVAKIESLAFDHNTVIKAASRLCFTGPT